ncbi:hypothetical protein [Candidatus Magnetaquicoccus inordinatus]|uniref:hypothetical protein n=1 Tax=Candidatus Magnetaquicoccus inordinatus TaxID=2496818 RepID=UPI00102C1702|nr:hypothetical protein [Candidatus Magnetaquicoccus inordinatus]
MISRIAFYQFTLVLLLSTLPGCASKGELDKLTKRIDLIEVQLRDMEKGLLSNQDSLKSDFKNLYIESQNEFRKIGSQLQDIRSKTDKFEVERQGEIVMIKPSTN